MKPRTNRRRRAPVVTDSIGVDADEPASHVDNYSQEEVDEYPDPAGPYNGYEQPVRTRSHPVVPYPSRAGSESGETTVAVPVRAMWYILAVAVFLGMVVFGSIALIKAKTNVL